MIIKKKHKNKSCSVCSNEKKNFILVLTNNTQIVPEFSTLRFFAFFCLSVSHAGCAVLLRNFYCVNFFTPIYFPPYMDHVVIV